MPPFLVFQLVRFQQPTKATQAYNAFHSSTAARFSGGLPIAGYVTKPMVVHVDKSGTSRLRVAGEDGISPYIGVAGRGMTSGDTIVFPDGSYPVSVWTNACMGPHRLLLNDATGRLIILSHRDHHAVDIDLSGTVHGVLDFPRAQHEGIAFDGQGNLHIVGEPNRHSLYSIP